MGGGSVGGIVAGYLNADVSKVDDRYEEVETFYKIRGLDGNYILMERNEIGLRRLTIFDNKTTMPLSETSGKGADKFATIIGINDYMERKE